MNKIITQANKYKKPILGYGFLFFAFLGFLLLIIGLQTQFGVTHSGQSYNENWQSFTEKYRLDIFYVLQNYSTVDMMNGNIISDKGVALIQTAIAGFSFLLISLPMILGFLYVLYQDYIWIFTRRIGKKLEDIKIEDEKQRALELKKAEGPKTTTATKPKTTTVKKTTTTAKPKTTTATKPKTTTVKKTTTKK